MKWPVCALLLLQMPIAQYVRNGIDRNNVNVAFDRYGPTSITYAGNEFLNESIFHIPYVQFTNLDGRTSVGDTASSRQVNQGKKLITEFYNWGRVDYQFRARNYIAFLDIRIDNWTDKILTTFEMDLMHVIFPSRPAEFIDGQLTISDNIGTYTALPMTYAVGTTVFTNENVTLPLLTGFRSTLNPPTSTIFDFELNTGRPQDHNPSYSSGINYINRPILPGQSLMIHLSMRFGGPGSTVDTLASDIFSKFSSTYPFTNTYSDHRSVGVQHLNISSAISATNPHGWLGDPLINTLTPSGIADFQSRLLTFASNSVTILQQTGSQGAITWDIEGQQAADIMYVGDPRLATTLAPELIGVIDQYFQVFTNAGLRVGVLIRPQQLVTGVQTFVANPLPILISKTKYAVDRWGATLIYVDSNYNPLITPIDASIFEQLHAMFPNVLFMPEHKDTRYYASTTPYVELRQGTTSTPTNIRPRIYPSAFSIIYVPDGDIDTNHSLLVDAVRAGDILLYQSWFVNSDQQKVKDIYTEAGQ